MTKENLKQFKDEICRHFDVVAEDLKSEIQLVAEGVSLNTQKLDSNAQKLDSNAQKIDSNAQKIDSNAQKLDSLTGQVALNTEKLTEHDLRFDKIDDTLGVIKLDIAFIKNELKQKVARDEFAVLERRVSMLEAKL